MIYVIGSGPAGVACASALLESGAQVTMLDAGLELEPDRRQRLLELQSVAFPSWDEASLSLLREGVEVATSGIPLKLVYGSEFPYRDPLDQPMTTDGVHAKSSFARGGLSNVWGASVLPYRTQDMREWPITVEDLAPHYRAALKLMPFSARIDGLEAQFPLHHDNPGRLDSSKQASDFLRDLELGKSSLVSRGITFGTSRLAIQAGVSGGKPGCVYCGKCLYGCPYEVIYNSSQSLGQLSEHRAFTYRSGLVVEQLKENGSQVEISGRATGDRAAFQIRADKVFVACGVLPTARIMLTSLDAYDQPIQAVDNCYYLLPLLRYRSRPDALEEPLYTLAQIFIEVLDEAIGPQTAHLQVYTYNELFGKEVRRLLGPMDRLLPDRLRQSLLGRLLLIQGYLHSDLSAQIRITLRRAGRNQPANLELAGIENPLTRPALSALQRRLWAERSVMRAIPIPLAMRVGEPGRGYHSGGTFPMRQNPGALETDLLGRPTGFSRVHLVDASVFPSLPATTITLSVMANAHRIGSAVLES
jgi:choline dehydrogenase-like flavoprotein